MNPDTSSKIFGPPALLAVALAGLLPWLSVQMNMALNTNHAWLTIAAARLIDGGHMATDVYETNPPLGVLLYFPVVFLSRLGVPLEYAPYVFSLIGLAGSAAAVWRLLALWPGISDDRRVIFIVSYLCASALIPRGLYFGERDEFVLWGLLPFLLAQGLVTEGIKLPPRFAFFVLPVCALCILLKPHYGIFSALMFLHRLMRRKNMFAVFFAPDFWALASVTILYVAIVLIFFRDYITVIFPDFVKYYVAYRNGETLAGLIPTLTAALILAAVTPFSEISARERRAVYALNAACVLSLFLCYLQGKGFVYHRLPAQIFLFCGAGVLVHAVAVKILGDRLRSHALAVLAVLAMAYIGFPPKIHGLTHAEYRRLKLPAMMRECAPDCSFFIFSQNMEMIWQTSLYSGADQASRFPGLWWLHSMLRDGADPAAVDKYAGMIAEDLHRHKPKILAIASNLHIDEKRVFSFTKFFGNNAAFRREMAHYRRTGVLNDNRGDYFKGTDLAYDFPLRYDLYTRR